MNKYIMAICSVAVVFLLVACGKKDNIIPAETPTVTQEMLTPSPVEPTEEAEKKLGSEVYEKALVSMREFDEYITDENDPLPSFYLLEDYGIYENEIKIDNDTNKTAVIIGEHIDIPESYILSVTAGEQVEVELAEEFLQALQELEVVREEKYVVPGYQNSEPYLDASALLLSVEGKYISIYIESYMDDTLQFTIMQDGQKELLATATSKEFKEQIRDLNRLKTVPMEEIKGITKLEYIDESKMWVPVSDKDMKSFLSFLDGAKQEAYGRTGCPFNNQLKATLADGEEITIFCASDSCGLIAVGDACYQPTTENRDRLYEFEWIKEGV